MDLMKLLEYALHHIVEVEILIIEIIAVVIIIF